MPEEPNFDVESVQRDHYNKISSLYVEHYTDKYSKQYFRRFIHEPMLEGVELKGMNVLNAMCGSGLIEEYLLEEGARVTGLDVSREMISFYEERWPGCNAICDSILSSGIEDNTYDCVIIIGGLHHLPPRIDEAVDEVFRLLKPGGYFCFGEPHSGSVMDVLRKLWYRRDKYFEKNEEAVDIDLLKKKNMNRFEFLKTQYIGSIAYMLVLNTMVFRIPVSLKPIYSSFLMALESAISIFHGKKNTCFSLSQWRKI